MAMEYRSLPTTIEGITLNFVASALATQMPNVRLDSVEIVDLNRGTCTKVRLRLKGETGAAGAHLPDTVILKGGFEPHSRKMAEMHRAEVLSYGTLVPVLGLRTPKVHFTGWDEDGQQGIVIMEDLRARGVDFCSPLRPQTFDQVATRLRVLARVHAQTWGSAEIRPGGRWDWLGDMPRNWNHYFHPYLEPDIWRHYVREPRGASASTQFHDREWMRDALDRMAALAATLPYCAIHGDTHLGNLYLDLDNEPGFFDCIATAAPGMLEVAYHIGCALDLSVRREWEGDLVRLYLDALSAHGAAAPAFEDAMHQYGVFLAYGYAIFIINEARFQTEANNAAYTARFSQAMLDHDTKSKLARIDVRQQRN